jgi:hypothetical protein
VESGKELAYHQTIIDLLSWISELDPVGPIELRCMWFDDFYFPGQTPPAGYPPEVRERGLLAWRECFSGSELRVLATFHALFDAEADALPTSGDWQQDSGWLRVSGAARTALAGMSPEALAPEAKESY